MADCRDCGGPKPPGRGRKVCDDCQKRPSQTLINQRSASRERHEAAPSGTRWCSRCENYLPLAQFGTRSNGRPHAYCMPCHSEYLHEHRLQKTFGIGADEYQGLLEVQGGRCAICCVKPRSRRLSVDHDHFTGEIRGLLCSRCNHKLLGSAKEDQTILRRAARYLDAPPAVTGSPLYLEGEERWLEVENTLADIAKNAGGDVAFVVHRPDGYGPGAIDGWPVTVRLADFTRLLTDAGYGTPTTPGDHQ